MLLLLVLHFVVVRPIRYLVQLLTFLPFCLADIVERTIVHGLAVIVFHVDQAQPVFDVLFVADFIVSDLVIHF